MNRRFLPLAALTLAALLWSGAASAQSCTGRFVNPITDVCWECLFPISIGPISIGSVSGVLDTPNPSSPICFCGSPIPASAFRSGSGNRRGWWTCRARPGASPTSAA